MAKERKLPRGYIQKDKPGAVSMKTCPNCTNGKIGGKNCIACNGKGKRLQA